MGDVRAEGFSLLPDAQLAGPADAFTLPAGFLDAAIAIRSCTIGVHGPETLHPDEASGLSPHAVEVLSLIHI